MKSRITIEVDFEHGNQPVIKLAMQASDDVRDKLLSHFSQQFGGSSWCKIRWVDWAKSVDEPIAIISVLREDQFYSESLIMQEQDKMNKEWEIKHGHRVEKPVD